MFSRAEEFARGLPKEMWMLDTQQNDDEHREYGSSDRILQFRIQEFEKSSCVLKEGLKDPVIH